MRIVPILVPLVVYLIVFMGTRTNVLVNADEAKYVRQAVAFSQGDVTVERTDPVSGETEHLRPSDYPPGTSMLLVPFVAIGGWQASAWLPALALCLMVIFTALLLRAGRWSPGFAFLILLFPPALVMSRVATSDVVSGTVVALGWWLFWLGARETEEGKKLAFQWLGAGFVAGLSLLFRETNALLFAPLFLGALIRRNRNWWLLLVGGLAGTGLRLASSWLVFNDPFFVKDAGYGFSLSGLVTNAPIYLLALLVFVPGGLVFAGAYRGFRRVEVIATVFLFFLFYCAYEYAGQTSGFLKSLVLGPRFFIPLLPVLAFAMAESAPRLLQKFFSSERRIGRFYRAVATAAFLSVICANVMFEGWSQHGVFVQKDVARTVPEGARVVTNTSVTEKYLTELQGYPRRADYRAVDTAELRGRGDIYIVFVRRDDSDYWLAHGEQLDRFLQQVETEELLDNLAGEGYRVQILRVIG